MEVSMEVIKRTIDSRLVAGNDDAFYILDIDDVKMKYRKWMEKMPRVMPFYAIKCNDDDRVVKTMVKMGAGFDCASKKEIKQVLDLGVDPERIIYAHTVKQISYLKYAADNQVMKVTFDSPAELFKIKEYHPKAQVVLRIKFDAEHAIISFGVKFGCDPVTEAPNLIKLCKELNMNLIGVSFHIGSGTTDFSTFEDALASVRSVFDVAENFGFKLTFVDIGGGFMGNDMSLLEHYAKPINNGLDKYFNDPSITIISEPGRYFVESALTLMTQVTLKKIAPDGHVHYYVNEGIYMSFLISFVYDEYLRFEVVRKTTSDKDRQEVLSTVWGLSCSSKDRIISDRLMPQFEMGDWLVFRNAGAYTTNCSTPFNGFKVGEVLTVDL